MDVFGFAVAAAGDVLRDAAIDAGYELDAFAKARTLDKLADDNGIGKGRRRLRALTDLLVGLGALRRDEDDVLFPADVPPRPVVARTGWGRMVEVFQRDKALDVEGGDAERRYHQQLADVNAARAAELAPLLAGASLLDLGAGIGTYTAAYLDRFGDARATAVDFFDVVPLTRRYLARFEGRSTTLSDEISTVQGRDEYDVALLANVLSLHDHGSCERIVTRAARLIVPGGRLVIADRRLDEDRSGPLANLLMALNLAVFTGGGDVHRPAQVRAWLEKAGLIAIAEHRLDSAPDDIVIVAAKPRGAAAVLGGIANTELTAQLPPALPASLRRFASAAMAAKPALAEEIRMRYALELPKLRKVQLADPIMQHPIAWHRLPRMRGAVESLFALMHRAGVPDVIGFATPKALFAEAPTLARLVERTYHGGAMPLPYTDLAYVASRDGDREALIDRYLLAPILVELCHFSRDRDGLPPWLDRCIAMSIAVSAWPPVAYPEPGCDDAITNAPWLAQVGQAFARRFGALAVIRAQAGVTAWDAVIPELEAVLRGAWTEWLVRETVDFSSDLFDGALPTGGPDDPDFDRVIVADALKAMCLAHELVGGSLRTRARVDERPILVDAVAMTVATAPHTEHDVVAPRYWLPSAIASVIRSRGHRGYELFLGSLAAIPAAVATLCDGAPPNDFTLVVR
ncbi:MAG: class I SAM-dependent methyltransferase [Kofleriaceae bacterium]